MDRPISASISGMNSLAFGVNRLMPRLLSRKKAAISVLLKQIAHIIVDQRQLINACLQFCIDSNQFFIQRLHFFFGGFISSLVLWSSSLVACNSSLLDSSSSMVVCKLSRVCFNSCSRSLICLLLGKFFGFL